VLIWRNHINTRTLFTRRSLEATKFVWDEAFRRKRHPLRSLEYSARSVLEWLLRAQQATPDDGVAEGYHVTTRKWSPSYPETTGYIICSVLRAARAKILPREVLQSAAMKMGTWLLTTQFKKGGFPGGNIGVTDPSPTVFNTGQILLGLTDLVEFDLDRAKEFHESAARAARWLIESQDDGYWTRGISKLTSEPVHAYNIRSAWALARFGKITGNNKAVQAGVRNAEWLIRLQDEEGWFPMMNFDVGAAPLTHTVAYTIRGLLELGLLCEREDFIKAATDAARKMKQLQDQSTGAIPGKVDRPYRSAANWTTATGNSQMAIIWFRIAGISGDQGWESAAKKANQFNRSIQEIDFESRNPGRRGALRGSFPGHKGYGRFLYMNWTQKFHLDALLEELNLESSD